MKVGGQRLITVKRLLKTKPQTGTWKKSSKTLKISFTPKVKLTKRDERETPSLLYYIHSMAPLEAAQLNAFIIFQRRLQEFPMGFVNMLQHYIEGRNGGWIQLRRFGFSMCRAMWFPWQCEHRLSAGTALFPSHTAMLCCSLCKQPTVPAQNCKAEIQWRFHVKTFIIPFCPVYAHKK